MRINGSGRRSSASIFFASASSAADMVSKSMRCEHLARGEGEARLELQLCSVSGRTRSSGRTARRSAAGSAAARASARGRRPAAACSCIIRSASLGSRQKMRKAWSKIGRCSWRESSTADMVQYQSSRRSGNWCAPAISSARTQSITRSGPMRRPAARSSRAKCITFSARRLPEAVIAPLQAAAPFSAAGAAAFARELLDLRRGGDGVLAEVALVVALELGQPVDVVHHQPGRALPCRARRCRPSSSGARATAPLPRWKRATGSSGSAPPRASRATGSSAHSRSSCAAALSGPRPGASRAPRVLRAQRARSAARIAFCSSQRAEPGDRRQRGEAAQVRELALELLGDLLDQQVAERDAAQPFLAVGDRVEHRAIGVRRRPPASRCRAAAGRARSCRASAPPR